MFELKFLLIKLCSQRIRHILLPSVLYTSISKENGPISKIWIFWFIENVMYLVKLYRLDTLLF
jgi:hypothetical protein